MHCLVQISSMSTMTREQATEAVRLGMNALREEKHQQLLKEVLAECNAVTDPMQQMQLKMQRMIPVVTEILGDAFKQENVMTVLMQVHAFAASDPKLSVDVAKIMRALGGDLSAVTEEDEFEEVE